MKPSETKKALSIRKLQNMQSREWVTITGGP